MSPLTPDEERRGPPALMAFIRWLAEEVAAELRAQQVLREPALLRPSDSVPTDDVINDARAKP